jgi:hypothetical protein
MCRMFIQSLKVIIFAKLAVYYQTNKTHPNKLTKARMQLAEISRKHKQKLWAEPQKLIRIKKAKGRAYYILNVSKCLIILFLY